MESVEVKKPFTGFYERLKKSKGHRQAVVVTARKLATIIYHLLTNQKMYEYDLMIKPKIIKMPVHKKIIRNNRINFKDKFVDMIQDVMYKPVRELSLMDLTR